MKNRILTAAAWALAGVSSLAAQTVGPSSIVIIPAAQPEGIRASLSAERGHAATADGRLWALGYWYQSGGTGREVRLFASADGARSWTLATKARTPVSAQGSLVVDPDGKTLHVAFMGKTNPAATYEWSIWYAPYDTVLGQWTAPDVQVLANPGTGSYDQVSAPNVAVNRKGHLLVSGIRSNGWTTWFKIFDGQAWTAEIKLQGGSYSKNSCVLEGPDDCFHFSYQSGGTYTAYYRRYDPMAQAFGAEGEILVKAGSSNETFLALTPAGDIFLGYITSPGSSSAAAGAMEVSHAKLGTWQFTPHTIYQDTRNPFTLTWGNFSFWCMQLARTGDSVRVYYTIPSGTTTAKIYDNILYAQDWNGQTFANQRTVFMGPPTSQITFPLARSCMPDGLGLMLTFTMQLYDNATPPNLLSTMLQAVMEPAAHVNYGLGCQTSGGGVPRTAATGTPNLGNAAFGLTLEEGIGAAGIVLLGTSSSAFAGLPLPFDLGLAGITGCKLYTNMVATSSALVTGGKATLPLPIPANPALAGARLPSQWLLLDAAAPGGIRFSGGGALKLW